MRVRQDEVHAAAPRARRARAMPASRRVQPAASDRLGGRRAAYRAAVTSREKPGASEQPDHSMQSACPANRVRSRHGEPTGRLRLGCSLVLPIAPSAPSWCWRRRSRMQQRRLTEMSSLGGRCSRRAARCHERTRLALKHRPRLRSLSLAPGESSAADYALHGRD
jgi:hypothetical protein